MHVDVCAVIQQQPDLVHVVEGPHEGGRTEIIADVRVASGSEHLIQGALIAKQRRKHQRRRAILTASIDDERVVFQCCPVNAIGESL
jgi:hypothetical protein